MQKRIDAYGVHIGRMERGPLNKISDVPGVLVGHCTVDEGTARTGVTVIVPGTENPFYSKLVAASFVLNGYGKTLGLVQVDELGTLETPIALTGTLNVGLVHDAIVEAMLDRCHAEGKFPTSLNPVVGECHDGRLSDLATRPVRHTHVRAALDTACADFAEGAVGAGRGMICHGLKGGIGSASRVIELDGERYTLGLLALTNHGSLADLTIAGRPIGQALHAAVEARQEPERGSVILVVATDLPVDARQLRRVLKRAPVGLARVGSYVGHGSGDIVIGFTTAGRVPFEEGPAVRRTYALREDALDGAFRAVAECCEEAVLNSMICAHTTTGFRGDIVYGLKELLEKENLNL